MTRTREARIDEYTYLDLCRSHSAASGKAKLASLASIFRDIGSEVTPIVLPITSGSNFARMAGFAVGSQTTGVIRCALPKLAAIFE